MLKRSGFDAENNQPVTIKVVVKRASGIGPDDTPLGSKELQSCLNEHLVLSFLKRISPIYRGCTVNSLR